MNKLAKLIILTAAIAAVGFTACGNAPDLSEIEVYDFEGMAISMPSGMTAADETAKETGLTAYYYCDNYMMTGLRDSFADYEAKGIDTEAFSLDDYAAFIERSNGMEEPFTPDSFGNPSVTYTKTLSGKDFFYYCTVRKGSDAFWIVTLACLEGKQNKYLPQFELWASTIAVE